MGHLHRALLVFMVLLGMSLAEGAGNRKRANHGRPAAEQEMRMKRIDCERTTCNGLRGEARATCTYQCISSDCFNEVYAHDELEEGEVDVDRARQYSFCYKKAYRKEQDAKLERMRKDAADRRAKLAERAKEVAEEEKRKAATVI